MNYGSRLTSILMSINMNQQFLTTCILVTVLAIPFTASGQIEVPNIGSESETIMAGTEDVQALPEDELELQRELFITARDTFYDAQTSANKTVFDEAAVQWAQDLVQGQLEYVDRVEIDLYDALEHVDGIDESWLQPEREQLRSILGRLEGLQTYAPARNIIGETIAVWDDVHDQVQQVRVYTLYDRYVPVLTQARTLHEDLIEKQRDLGEQYVINPEDADWAAWQQVVDTYTSNLAKLEQIVLEQRERVETPYDWEALDDDDEVWQEEIAAFTDFLQTINSLQTLQSQSIDRYLAIENALISPANQPLE